MARYKFMLLTYLQYSIQYAALVIMHEELDDCWLRIPYRGSACLEQFTSCLHFVFITTSIGTEIGDRALQQSFPAADALLLLHQIGLNTFFCIATIHVPRKNNDNNIQNSLVWFDQVHSTLVSITRNKSLYDDSDINYFFTIQFHCYQQREQL